MLSVGIEPLTIDFRRHEVSPAIPPGHRHIIRIRLPLCIPPQQRGLTYTVLNEPSSRLGSARKRGSMVRRLQLREIRVDPPLAPNPSNPGYWCLQVLNESPPRPTLRLERGACTMVKMAKAGTKCVRPPYCPSNPGLIRGADSEMATFPPLKSSQVSSSPKRVTNGPSLLPIIPPSLPLIPTPLLPPLSRSLSPLSLSPPPLPPGVAYIMCRLGWRRLATTV